MNPVLYPLNRFCLPAKPDHWCDRCRINLIGLPLPQEKYHLETPTDSTGGPCKFVPREHSKGELRGA